MFAEPILHLDMDAFYVEVERLDDASLHGVPVIVGGLGNRGVVAAASYEARRYGVGSAMPMTQARKLCRNARFIPPRHDRYGEVSAEVFAILREVCPVVEGISVDEAFLDVSSLRLHYPGAADVGRSLRRRIRAELGLPASVGVAASKLIAKLASEDAKPDGLLHITAEEQLDYLHGLHVRRLWGVGEATHAALEQFGIETIGDLAATAPKTLALRLGPSLGQHLHDLAHARDPRPVESGAGAKSISVEATYEVDLTDEGRIERELFGQCERLAQRLRRSGHAARTITLKLRYGDFSTITRSHTVTSPVDVTRDLWSVVRELLERVELDQRGVRLLGVGASGLSDREEPRQMVIGGAAHDALAEAADRVRDRFGDAAVVPAALADDVEKHGRKGPVPR